MFLTAALPLVGLLLVLPGLPRIPGLPSFGIKDLKKLRQTPAAPLDSLPPAWKPVSRLAIENPGVLAALPPLGPPLGLKATADPRRVSVAVDPDSSTVRYATEFGGVTLGEARRVPLRQFTTELSGQSFQRIWVERSRERMLSGPAVATASTTPSTGLRIDLPSPLPARVQSLLGPGGPSISVSGSESIRLSGQSQWTNQQVGLLGQRRSLFPSLDMQQNLDIRLEGRLSDRVGVNLLQNSTAQIPLTNRIAINYKGDEDDLIQALDLGNTNLSLPGTQYVSYSGKNEGLFGMKATTRLGPLDFTVLASKQEGRSERASYAGGSSRQTQQIPDKDYVKGVYFFLSDPNAGGLAIDDASLRIYLDEGIHVTQVNTVRGRAFVDPRTAVRGAQSDSTPSVRGTFRLLKAGADQDYEILSDVYGPFFKVIRLRSALSGERQRLAVTYRYREILNGVAVGDSVAVGGRTELDHDGVPSLTMKLLRASLDLLPDADGDGLFDSNTPFAVTRDLELRNFYQLSGQRVDPKTFEMTIRKGDDFPPKTTARPGLPYIQVLGLDNFDESSGFVDFNRRGHDDRVDGTAPTSNFRAFLDFDRGTLFFPDLRPFAPRIRSDGTGRPFEQFVSTLLFRSDSLIGPPGSDNEANPAIYDKRVVLNQDREYTIEVQFTAARAGNEVLLGRTNIVEGSDVVTINGQPLQRDRDYRIDYDFGRVTMIRQLGPSDQLNIDYSYAPLFQQAGRTLVGNAFRWEGHEKSLGGAFVYESKGAQDLRPRLGEEPSRVLIGDLNSDWRFRPDWITRLVDRLPGVRTTQPSELHVQAEVGASFPNPNTRNELFLDDMEGSRDAVALAMSPERWRWSSVPLDPTGLTIDARAGNPQMNTEVRWYSPLNAVKERELKPSLSNAQGAQNSRQVLAISLPRRPTAASGAQPLWAGLTYVLDPVGIDLSRAQFLDLWVNDFRDHHGGVRVDRVRGRGVKLRVDVGVVPEDQQRAPNIPPNGRLDSEDIPPRDNQLTVAGSNNEDTGLDNRLNPLERPELVPDLSTADPANDPEGDDFALPNERFKDWDPRKWRRINGTEGNKNAFPLPDTEDLNLNNALDTQSSYFEYSIDLGDSTHRYLLTDIHGSFRTYANDGSPVPEDNGWRRFRIPLSDTLRTRFGTPDLTLTRHVRVWIEDVVEVDPPPLSSEDGRPFLAIGGLEIVGSRWFVSELDSLAKVAGTTITLNTVNTVDNADLYVPPFDPGKTRSGSQELVRREQALALEFSKLEKQGAIEVYKTFSLDENYSRYGQLSWFVAAFDVPGYDAEFDSLDYFMRFASDEKGNNYYEVRSRLPRSSAPGRIEWKEVSLVLTDISNLKLNPDFPTGSGLTTYRAPGRSPGEEYIVRGRPSFTRLRRISFGVVNASPKAFRGQVWLNELRATDVAKDVGRAQRVHVNGQLANLASYNLSWNGRDADFQSVGETRGSGSHSNQFNLQTNIDLHRFFEATKIILPLRIGYQTVQSSPRFTAGDDVVRGGALAEASDTRQMSRTVALNYSRTWSPRSHPLLLYTLGGISASYARTMGNSRTPISVDTSRSTAAAVSYGIAPRSLLAVGLPRTKLKLYPLPERLFWNYSVQTSEARGFDRQRDASGLLHPRSFTKGRNAAVDFGADTRPLDFFRHGFQGTRSLVLKDELMERIGFINLGRVVRWSQNMDARIAVSKHGPWLQPNFSWNSRYLQNNGPELSPDLSVRSIQNGQTVQLSWSLPFDRLAGRAGAPPDTAKSGPDPLRRWLSRIGPLHTDAGVNTSSSHSRLTGTPSLLYLVGLSRDPGLGSDSSGRVLPAFGNQSDEVLDWRFGARTTIDLGLEATLRSGGEFNAGSRTSNRVPYRSNRVRFPELEIQYGRIPNVVGLSRILSNPRLRTLYNRSQSVDFANSDEPTSVATSSEWRPLLELSGDLKNGARAQVRVERRVTESENRLLGNSVTTDRTTNLSFGLTRSYAKGQKVNVLGKEMTVRSSVNLGMSMAYDRRSGETIQLGFDRPQYERDEDRLSVNLQGGYSFSNNVTGNLDLGFGQNRDLQREIVNRNVRVELRAQFTF